MSLRIAHVSATFPPYSGGTGNVCLHNARQLAHRGHSVTVFTAAASGAPAHEARDGFAVRRLRPLVRVGNAPVLPGLLPALRGFDLIHLHYPFIFGAEQAAAAALAFTTPLVVTFHNDLLGDGARAAIFTLYQRLSALVTVRGAAMLCAVSLDHFQASRLRRDLMPRLPAVAELSNGVDLAHFTPGASSVRAQHGISADVPLLLFVAALDRAHHFKGLSRLLAACAQLPPAVHLLVVGDGDQRASYEAEAERLGLGERVVFVGNVDNAELPPYYRAADLTVLPSDPPESFGLVLAESMACGTPVVASDIAGVRTVVEHGRSGLLTPPGAIPALTAALHDLLADRARRDAMGAYGRAATASRYGWPAIGQRLEQLYCAVLAGSGRTVEGTF